MLIDKHLPPDKSPAMRILLILFTLLILLPACTITKRHYRPGWHVSFHGKQKAAGKTEDTKTLSNPETIARKSDTPVLTDEIPAVDIVSENELTDDTTNVREKAVVIVRTNKRAEKDSIRRQHRIYQAKPPRESDTQFKLPPGSIVFRMICYLLLAAIAILILIGILYIVEFASAISTGGLILLMLLLGAPIIMLLIYGICQLFNRKEPLIPDEKKRNRRYWLIAACTMLLPLLILALYINSAF